MDTNLTPSVPRSLVRRWLWPVGMALTVIGASTGGAYWCLNDTAEAQNPLRPHPANSAKDQLKELFSEQQHQETANAKTEELFGGPPAAGAPQVVGSEQANPTTLGDRYGSYTPVVEPTSAPTVDTTPAPEITRGQDSGGNPLRIKQDSLVKQATVETPVVETPVVAATEPVEDDFEAGEGFSTGTPTEAPITSAMPPVEAEAVADTQHSLPPLEQAKASSLPATNPFAAPLPPGNDRYASATPLEPTPSAADLGAANTALGSREPTPAFPLDQPPAPAPVEPELADPGPVPMTAGITPTPGLVSQPGSGRPGERLLEGAQTPSLTILKLAPPEIQVGKRCTFGIRVQNTGQRTAQNVQIHDEIPLGTQLVGTAPRAAVSGGKVVWDIGTLSVGEERTVEMELLPTEEGEIGSVATVMMAAQASAKARCTKPELTLRLSSQPQVHAGQQQVVQVEVSNPGTGVATGVMIFESVPSGVSHEAGPALEFEIGSLAAGETRRLELLLTAEQAGRVINTMTAKADAGLHVEASCEFEVIAPDLQVSVDGPDRRFLERPATYQVSIDNPGTAPAKEVQLVTHLPKGLQFVSANNLGEYDATGHSVYWSLAELPANERGTVELTTLPVEPGQHTLQVTTKARDGLSDEAHKEVIVEGIAALMFEVVDRDDPIEVGGETAYEIRVVNQGSKAASDVQVTAIMPPGLRPLGGHGDTRHAVQGDRVVFAPIPQLAPKAESTFRIQVQGVRDGDHRTKVQITTAEIREPITKEELTRVYSDQ